MAGAAARVLGALPAYAKLAWWGLAAPRLSETRPLVVVQAVILAPEGVLLAVRRDLQGWELPGGTPLPGEADPDALRREAKEETGLELELRRHVGDYVRSGFRPHTARVYLCERVGGRLARGDETLCLRYFDPAAPPDTLFPWYRAPLADALAGGPPVRRHEHQGPRAVLAGMRIDLRMRLRGVDAP